MLLTDFKLMFKYILVWTKPSRHRYSHEIVTQTVVTTWRQYHRSQVTAEITPVSDDLTDRPDRLARDVRQVCVTP